ncbi:major capsid protein VP54 [Acanthocystis turfacea Chlorella virus Can0610SP]|nr:major capsid protein VP54 [Acanthocystis turfacea Chlorella virus Can0610SP]
MPGAVSQLVSYGAQDVYLTGNPQITFFKAIYRRYTNFAVESIQQAMDGTTDFGKFPTCTISRNGDLAGPIWIEVTLPNLLGYNITPTPPVQLGNATLANASNVLTLSNVYTDASGNYWQSNNAGVYSNLIAAYSNVTGNYYASANVSNIYNTSQYSGNIITWPYMVATANVSNAGINNFYIPTANLRYVNGIGLALFNSVELQLGGQRIDKHYSEWWDIWSELTETAEHLQGYNTMVGRYDPTYYDQNYDITQSRGGTYYVPLKFCYNTNPGQYLPLVALSYHDVKLNFDINNYLNCIRCNYPVTSLTSQVGSNPLAITNFKLYCDYVFLDAPERIRMSEIQHEYLVTQLQWQGTEPVTAPSDPNGTTNRKITLNFNHPVKCIIIVYQAASSVAQGDAVDGNDIFNYQIPGDTGAEIIESMTLLINGSERFSARDGAYFRLVQPYQHSVRVPSKSVYMYSFALEDIDSKQPCGSANFTRYDSAQLQMVLNSSLPSGQFQIFAPNYNILRVASGMGGLAFAN